MNDIIRNAEFARGGGLRQNGFGVRPKSSKPKSPRPPRWSHQQELEALKGKGVVLTYLEGDRSSVLNGTLLEADQFTIKLDDGFQFPRIIFKSALIAFRQAA